MRAFIQDSFVNLPSLHFKRCNTSEIFEPKHSVKKQIEDSIYDISRGEIISNIWRHLESLLNGILHDLRTINDDEICTIVRIGTLQALQPKWLVVKGIMDAIIELGNSECHVFADKVDILLFYRHQAQIWVSAVLRRFDFLFSDCKNIASSKAIDLSIEENTIQNLFSKLFRTRSCGSNIKNYKSFLSSLLTLSSSLIHCADAQTYYLFKNTCSLYDNVERFQQQKLGIYSSRREIFFKDYQNAIKTLGRKKGVQYPEKDPMIREDAFTETIRKSYPTAYQQYESNRGMLESLHNCMSHTDDGRLRAFFSTIFQTHYKGEQRNEEGVLIKVDIDERGNTSVVGKSGWENWLDFLTVITLVREYENNIKEIQHPASTPNGFKTYVVKPEKANVIVKRIVELVNAQSRPKAIMMPIRAAIDAGAISRPNWESFVEEFGEGKISSKTSFTDYTNPDKTPYTTNDYQRLREEFYRMINE